MKDSLDFPNWQTVVLTPGFGCLPHTLGYLGSILKEKYNVVYAPNGHRINTVSIHISATELEEKLQKLFKHVHMEETSLVGHSMGGLISVEAVRIWASMRVNNIITISTPFQGTPMASLCSPFLRACEEINTPGWFHKNTNIGHKLWWLLISNVSEKDFVVPAGCQIPQNTIAPRKTKIIRHTDMDHKDSLVWETCKTIANIVKKYCK